MKNLRSVKSLSALLLAAALLVGLMPALGLEAFLHWLATSLENRREGKQTFFEAAD